MMIKIVALTHYNKMIRWAEKQPKHGSVDPTVMEDEIGECWEGDYCSYCKHAKNNLCDGCPLFRGLKKFNVENCCDGLWQAMDKSKTWGTWTKRAKKVMEYIESHG